MGNVQHTTVDIAADLRYSVRLSENKRAAYVFVGDLQLCFGGDVGTQVAAIARLREALSDLRDEIDRASEPPATADDMLAIREVS